MKKQCPDCKKWLAMDTYLKMTIPVCKLPLPAHSCINDKLYESEGFPYNDLTYPRVTI